jgi:site-specific recombinase XerD
MRPRKKDRHLPKCLYKRHGGYYLVKGGVWEPLGRDLAAALAEYGRRHADVPKGLLDRLIDDAFEHIKTRPTVKGKPISQSTAEQYAERVAKIKHLLRFFTAPQQIKPKDVAKIKVLLQATPNMANQVLSVLRSICGYWLEQQLIESNPAVGVTRHAVQKRKRLISDDEFRAIYGHAPPRLQVMLDLWRLTGQRVMDVVTIRRADLKDEGLYFRQEKTDAELIVKWNPELKAAVDRAKSLYGNVRALTLFHTRRGSAPSYRTVYDQWCRAFKRAGVEDVQIRDLRAVSITRTNRQHGKKAAQDIAAHTTGTMTDRYIRDHEIPVVDGPSFGRVLDIGQKGS